MTMYNSINGSAGQLQLELPPLSSLLGMRRPKPEPKVPLSPPDYINSQEYILPVSPNQNSPFVNLESRNYFTIHTPPSNCSTSIHPSPSPDISHSHSHSQRLFHGRNSYRISKPYRPSASACQNTSAFDKSEKRRRDHQNSEKKRRENIKAAMDALFEIIPDCRDIKSESKAMILDKAFKYIRMLEHRSDVLGAENVDLKQKLASLCGDGRNNNPWPYVRIRL